MFYKEKIDVNIYNIHCLKMSVTDHSDSKTINTVLKKKEKKLYSNPAALHVYSLCGFEFQTVRMLWYAIYMFYSRQGEV